uniref:FHA domain-containing protein n=1 Tax=Parastrongyloides trichosuri TaxID=131310 RepID=A0A0N4ZG86_PARTI
MSNDNFAIPSSLPTTFVESNKTEDVIINTEESAKKIVKQYIPPEWGMDVPDDSLYYIDIIKEGVIAQTVKLNKTKNKSYFTIGRTPENDIIMLHPSISRIHAIIQYGDFEDGLGYYIMDYNSSHKTKLNRKIINPNKFVKLRNGYNIQVGGSTRFIIFNGPDKEQEEENERHSAEYARLKQISVMKKKVAMGNLVSSSTEKHFDYDNYDSRDTYEEEPNDEQTDSKIDQAEEFWNEMAKRRKQKIDDDDNESLWDETKSIADIRKRKAEEEAFLESLKSKPSKIQKKEIPIEEINEKIKHIEEVIKNEKEKISSTLKEYKIDEDNDCFENSLLITAKIPKKQGLTVPINKTVKMELAQRKSVVKGLEIELNNLKKLTNNIIEDKSL